MNGGRLITGITIIIFLVMVELVATYLATGTGTTTASFVGCTSANNTTTVCQQQSQSTFFQSLFTVSTHGFADMDPFLNNLWLIVTGILLATAILLIALSFTPLTNS